MELLGNSSMFGYEAKGGESLNVLGPRNPAILLYLQQYSGDYRISGEFRTATCKACSLFFNLNLPLP